MISNNVAFWQLVDSYEPVQLPFKLRNSIWCSVSSLSQRIFKHLAKALISLRVCAGWSEPLLVAHSTLLKISFHGSIMLAREIVVLFKYAQKNPLKHPYCIKRGYRSKFLAWVSININSLCMRAAKAMARLAWAFVNRHCDKYKSLVLDCKNIIYPY